MGDDLAPAVERIISGGQTGADRGALDFALERGIRCGGWCPRGRRAEDGVIDERYPLAETPSPEYAERTRWNVRDADGTLVFTRGELGGGTALTVRLAEALRKPWLRIDLGSSGEGEGDVERVRAWLRRERIRILNVAGVRESAAPGIGEAVGRFLDRVFPQPRAVRGVSRIGE